MKNDEQILEDSIFNIGKVISVVGKSIKIEVSKNKNTSHLIFKGELLKNTSVGGYVKIIKGFTKIIGKVDGEFVEEDKKFVDNKYGNEKEKIKRTLNISLLGYFKGDEFERGIKELPLIDNECFLLHTHEFNQVHNFLRNKDEPIVIGALTLEKGQKISIGIESLFASHIGIFGNTGSGKSYTLAKIYRELFLKFKDQQNFKKNSQFFIIDFNGEYVEEDTIIEKEYKKLYKLSTRSAVGGDKFPIEKTAINDPDFWAVLSEATEKTQTPFLTRALDSKLEADYIAGRLDENVRSEVKQMIAEIIRKQDKNLGSKIFFELFSDIYNSVKNQEVIKNIKQLLTNKLRHNSTLGTYYAAEVSNPACYSEAVIARDITGPLFTLIDSLNFEDSPIAIIRIKIVLKYYDEIIKGHSNRDHLSPLIKRIENRIKDLQKVIKIEDASELEDLRNISIVSLKDVNVSIKKVLPLLLCKKLYEDKKNENNKKKYLNLIIDEAHNILSQNSERESEQWKDHRLETFEEIIKEGRKFGVFLTIASQRPSDISDTIVSQLHNYFLHRLVNNNDIVAVEKTVAFLDKVSFDSLPILPTGTCILTGLLAQVPVIVDIDPIEEKYAPKNETMKLITNWLD